MTERVLITGGAGYIGAVMTEEFLREDYSVTIIDNFLYRQPSLLHLCMNSRLEVVRGDARDPAQVTPLLRQADLVIPLAALVGAPLCAVDPVGAETINREAVRMLLGLMAPSQRIIYPATNSVYGSTAPGTVCTEASPINPISLYGRTKAEAEAMTLARNQAVSLRLATVFGLSSRMRVDLLVNDFVHRAVTDRAITLFEADFRRNFIHIRDVARAFVHVARHYSDLAGQIYNVGAAEENYTKLDICEHIQRHVPDFSISRSGSGSDPDKRNYIVSNQKFDATGFKTRYSLDDGIVELAKGYRCLNYSPFVNF